MRGIDAFNVSVVPDRGALWERNLAVRDFLRAHPDWAERYGQVKLSGAAASGTSMLGYQDRKHEFGDTLRTTAVPWVREHDRNGR